MGKSYRNYSTTFKKPNRPFESERLESELKTIGQYGLKNKREVWRVQYLLTKIRAAARVLLTLDSTDERRMFEGEALLRRMTQLGLLEEHERKLDYVLGLTVGQMLDRRLQTRCFKLQIARSIHHSRVLVKQRHVRVGRQICDVPSFCVRTASEKHIDFASTSPFGGGRPGRCKRKSIANGGGDKGADEDED